MTQPTLEQFLDDVKRHEITIHQNNGVYRHLTFKNADDCHQSFNITTFPDHLVITGDMGTLVFSRLYDMFNFFRSDDLRIKPDCWDEKIQSMSRRAKDASFLEFDIDKIKEYAQKIINNFINDNMLSKWQEEDLLKTFKSEILRSEDEHELVEAIRQFSFRDVDFTDFREGDYSEYRYEYIWLCYAIVWGIKKFDELNKE